MDLSQQLKKLIRDDEESEKKNKMLLQLSVKKVQVEKNIRDANLKLTGKEAELVNIRNENILLDNECLVLGKRTEIARSNVEDLLKRVVIAESKTKQLQVTFPLILLD